MSAFRYPHPTNEVAARLVAGMVALLGGSVRCNNLTFPARNAA